MLYLFETQTVSNKYRIDSTYAILHANKLTAIFQFKLFPPEKNVDIWFPIDSFIEPSSIKICSVFNVKCKKNKFVQRHLKHQGI